MLPRIPHTTLFCTLLLLCPYFCPAQPHLPEPVFFSCPDFERIDHIQQDGRGFVWLATNRGLFCFDGTFFRKIRHAPHAASAIDNGQVQYTLLDKERKKLWLATPNGVSVLNLPTETFTDHRFSQGTETVAGDGSGTAILKSRQGDIWVGIHGFGLARLDTVITYFQMKADRHNASERIPITIFQMAQDVNMDSLLWLATDPFGLVAFNTCSGRYTIPEQQAMAYLPGGRVIFTTLFPTRQKIYLGNEWRTNTCYYDLYDRSFTALALQVPGGGGAGLGFVNAQPHTPHSFWGTHAYGIFMFDTQQEQLTSWFPKPDDVKAFYGGFLANNNGLWTASQDGLLWYDFSTYKVENHILRKEQTGLPAFVTSVLEKEDGSGLWVSFQNSNHVYAYDRHSRQLEVLPSVQGAPHHLLRLQQGKTLAIAGTCWYELEDNRLIPLPRFDALVATGEVTGYIEEDGTGRLWMCSATGSLYQIDPETGSYQNVFADKEVPPIANIFLDQQDRIWAGWNGGGGFSVYDAHSGALRHFPYHPGIEKTIHYPRGLAQDKQGKIWISDTRVGGLLMADPERIEAGIVDRYIGQAEGMVSHYMYALQADEKGRIWAITKEGLQVFNPLTRSFRLFGRSAGFRLQGKVRTMSNFIPAYLTRLSTGEMLAGYSDGFAIFHPDSLLAIREYPLPYLLSVKANEVPVAGLSFRNVDNLRLKHRDNSLEFAFSALGLYGSERPCFRYRLKGSDDQWAETRQASVRYVQLHPAAYTFQLQLISSDGKPFSAPLEVHFFILPPWWRSGWAYCLYTLFLVSLLWLYYERRKRRWHLRAQLAMEQREAERLIELDRFKTSFYTNITHEFRTPITLILGMVDQIKKHPETWYHEGLTMIRRNGNNLLRLVNQMLELSRLEAGILPVHMIQSDVIAYLKYLLESFQSPADSQDITLQFRSDTDELVMDFDPEKLQQIVSNLISNAMKFTPRAGRVGLTVMHTPRHLVLTVYDTGHGIPTQHLPYIFDRFYRGEHADSRAAAGAGIGLALTRELVRLMGGNISVRSAVGKGTTFEVILPVRHSAQLVQYPEPSDERSGYGDLANGLAPMFPHEAETKSSFPLPVPPSGTANDQRPSLLIVEDNADVVRYLKACLQNDYRLTVAHNGLTGYEQALEIVPDIVISDVMMPVMDGFELCDRLKSDFRTSHIPVVLLTARADLTSRIEGVKRGADAYLAKPFHQEELSVHLQKLLESRKRLQKRYQTPSPPPTEDEAIRLEDAFIQQVNAILEAHLGDEYFGIPDLCREMGMSRAQLYRKFKALTDQPVGYYFRSLRLHQAKAWLLTTDRHISEIAYDVGFKEPAYFTRVFRETFGISPKEMRKRHLS